MDRPDLTAADPEIVRYVEFLEEQLAAQAGDDGQADLAVEPAEPPTTIQVVTISQNGLIKRTPRHFYTPQRRGGMGVFDLDLPADDLPAALLLADLGSDLIFLTNFARVFRLPVDSLPERPVRARGDTLATWLRLHEKETIAAVLGGSGAHIAVLTTRGFVLTRNKNFLKNEAILFDSRQSGEPVAACWSTGLDDLFVSTQAGKAIRFGTRQVPTRGCLSIRLDEGDRLLGITAVEESGGVLLVAPDGKGTIRLMSGFRTNKSPGAAGKTAINTDRLVAALAAAPADDVLIISRLGKIIRFHAAEIPAKDGVVQGVNCMSLRADEVVAAAVARMNG